MPIRTTDPAVWVACEGCRQKRHSGVGLSEGVTFAQCVEEHTKSVRAKLARDPHRYNAVLPEPLRAKR
jgi:hypothetical protein